MSYILKRAINRINKLKGIIMKSLAIKLVVLLFAAASISTTLVTAAEMNLTGNRDPQSCNGTGDRKRDRLQQKDPNCVPKKDGSGKKNKKGNKKKINKKKGNGNKKGNGDKQGKGR